MSGGAFDYLYRENCPTSTVSQTNTIIRNMIGFLYVNDRVMAANELRRIAQGIEQESVDDSVVEAQWKALKPVMKDAEWWASGDIDGDTFDSTYKEYADKYPENVIEHLQDDDGDS